MSSWACLRYNSDPELSRTGSGIYPRQRDVSYKSRLDTKCNFKVGYYALCLYPKK